MLQKAWGELGRLILAYLAIHLALFVLRRLILWYRNRE